MVGILLISCSNNGIEWEHTGPSASDFNLSLASSANMFAKVQEATGYLNNRSFDGLNTNQSYISVEPKFRNSESSEDGDVVVIAGSMVWCMDTLTFSFPSICLDGRVYDVNFNQSVTEYNIEYNGEIISDADVKIKGTIKLLGVYSRVIAPPRYDCDVDLKIMYDMNQIHLKIEDVESPE